MSIKVKAGEGQKFKSFELEIEPITWKQRCKLNDMMIHKNNEDGMPDFTFWGSIVLEFTKLSEDKLNNYSTDEIIAIANTIFEEANKKK